MSCWPVTFEVGLTTPGLWRGGGRLLIAPGSLVCIPGHVTAGLSKAQPGTYRGKQVHLYTARLVPPWFNVTLPVRADTGTLVASMWILGRRRLRQTLREAGFDVVEHVTWTDRGFRWAEM